MEWKRLLKDWGIALVVASAIYLVIGWFRGKPDLPEFAPDFQLHALDGQSLSLDELKGRTVVVNFWASWCGPCRAEIPEFTRFANDNPEVAVLGFAVQSGGPEDVLASARKLGIGYPVAIAPDALQAAYDISTLPTTVVIDPTGRVKGAHVGAMSYRGLAGAVE